MIPQYNKRFATLALDRIVWLKTIFPPEAHQKDVSTPTTVIWKVWNYKRDPVRPSCSFLGSWLIIPSEVVPPEGCRLSTSVRDAQTCLHWYIDNLRICHSPKSCISTALLQHFELCVSYLGVFLVTRSAFLAETLETWHLSLHSLLLPK